MNFANSPMSDFGSSDRSVEVLVVIVTHNNEESILELLDSVPMAVGAVGTDVVVVDNGSVDRTADLVAERSDCLLVRAENIGFAAGVNLGAKQRVGHRAMLWLNGDTVLGPGAVASMLDACGWTNARIGIVAPQVVGSDGGLDHSLRRRPSILSASGLSALGISWASERMLDDSDYLFAQVVDWAVGAALLVSMNCYEELGGMDESYFLYSEETDFCLRALDRGWHTLFVPGAVVVHRGGGSGRSDATHVMQVLNRVRLYARRNGRAKSAIYYALNVLSELTWAVRGQRSARASIRALLRPSVRPGELALDGRLIPT